MRARWLVGLAFLSGVGSALAACAQGSSFSGSGGDGEGGDSSGEGPVSSASSSGAGASGGSGGSGGAGGTMSGTGGGATTSSSSSSSSSTGSGGACAESPCKLVAPQCGCAAGEACAVDGSGARSCVTAGSVAEGGICDLDNECAAGGLCLQTTAGVSTCGKFCATDAQCQAPGGLCVLTLDDGNGGAIPGVKLCTDNCNMITNAGCVAGTGCRIGREAAGQMRLFTACGESGVGVQGSSCVDNTDCGGGFGCFNVSPAKCLKYCNTASPTCPAGTTCNAFTIGMDMVDPTIGSITYGACL